MPVYTFLCEQCNNKFELTCSISEYDDLYKYCPVCETDKHMVRDFSEDNVHGSVKNVKTLGQLAEKNRKKYGEELSQKMIESYKTKVETPPGLPEGAKVVPMDPKVKSNNKRKLRERKKRNG